MSAALGLAVQALNASQMRDYGSLIERLNREGDPTGTAQRLNFTTFAGGSTISPISTPAVGRAIYVKQFNAFSTSPLAGRLQMSNVSAWSGSGTTPLMDVGFSCGPGYAATLDVDQFIRSGDRTGVGVLISQWLDSAVAGTQVFGVGATAWSLADSINFDAKKVILMLGDSTWNGTGPTTVDTCIPYLINRFFREQGQDTRYILKAYSGSTSQGHENFRGSGKYEFPQVDALFDNLGINDAVQGLTTAASMANLQARIAWRQRRYPKAKHVVFGTTPLQNSTLEAALAAYRAAAAAYIADLGDPNVKFCDLGGSFNRTVDANYAVSDGAGGTRIHPVDPALTQVWNGGYNGNIGLRAWLLANLPVI